MNAPLRIIGVTGPAAAGKDTAAEVIAQTFGGLHVSAGDMIRLFTRYLHGLPDTAMPTREQLYSTAAFIRSEVNPTTTIILAEEKARLSGAKLLIISGLRALEEAEAIQARGGIVVGISAPAELRFERIKERDRDSEAWESLEQFLKRDNIENEGTDGQGINAILARANLVIENGTNDTEELRRLVREKLAPLL